MERMIDINKQRKRVQIRAIQIICEMLTHFRTTGIPSMGQITPDNKSVG